MGRAWIHTLLMVETASQGASQQRAVRAHFLYLESALTE